MKREVHSEQRNTGMLFKDLNTAWQLIGALTFPVLFTFLFIVYLTTPGLNMFQWLLWLHLPIIMLHECEEYIFPGGFKDFFNRKTIFSPTPLKEEIPVSEPYILFVNPILVWPWAILGAVFYTFPWIGISLVFFMLAINNVQHIVIFQFRQRGYNPGLFTTMFVLMPYCTLVLWYVLVHPVMTTTDWILAFAVAAGVFLTLMSTTMMRRKHAATG